MVGENAEAFKNVTQAFCKVRSTRNRVITKLRRHRELFKDGKPGGSEGPVTRDEHMRATGTYKDK